MDFQRVLFVLMLVEKCFCKLPPLPPLEDDAMDKFVTIYSKHFSLTKTATVKMLTDDGNVDVLYDFYRIFRRVFENLLKVVSIENHRIHTERNNSSMEVNEIDISYVSTEKCENIQKHHRSKGWEKQGHIVLVEEPESLYQLTMKEHVVYNGLNAIVFLSNDQKDCKDFQRKIAHVLASLWEQKYLNVIAQAPFSCEPENFYIYRPFKGTSDRRGLLEVIAGDQLNQFGLLLNNVRDLHGYPFKMSMFQRNPTLLERIPRNLQESPIYKLNKKQRYYGLDGSIITELSTQMNFEIKVDRNRVYYGIVLPNGTATGSLGKVIRQEVDMAGNSRFVDNFSSLYSYTLAISNENMCVIVPKAVRMPKWIFALRGFKISVWIALLFSFILIVLFWYLHKKLTSNNFQLSTAFLDIGGMFVGTAIIKHGTKFHFLLLVCMFTNIIFSNIFQGNLYKSFSEVKYFPDVNSLEELIHSNLKISTTLHIFNEVDTDIFKRLRNIVLDSTGSRVSSLDKAAFNKNVAALERQTDAEMLIETVYKNGNGEKLLHIIRECPRTYFVAYIVPNNSPYVNRINHILQRFIEAGLVNKWNQDVIQAEMIQSYGSNRGASNTWRGLLLGDVQVAFLVLVIGYLISIIAFVREVSYMALKRRKISTM